MLRRAQHEEVDDQYGTNSRSRLFGTRIMVCDDFNQGAFMAAKKSVLAQRVNELENAVTRLFTGEAPAPKKAPRKRKAKKAKTMKKAAKKVARKVKKAVRKAKRKARR
jgi:hypothetical protein